MKRTPRKILRRNFTGAASAHHPIRTRLHNLSKRTETLSGTGATVFGRRLPLVKAASE